MKLFQNKLQLRSILWQQDWYWSIIGIFEVVNDGGDKYLLLLMETKTRIADE